MYSVIICYSGAVSFDVEADNEEEAKKIAQKEFDEVDDRALVANLNDIVIDEIFELEEQDAIL